MGAAGGITAVFALNCLHHAHMLSKGASLSLVLVGMAVSTLLIVGESELGARAMLYGAAAGGSAGLGIGVAREVYSFFKGQRVKSIENAEIGQPYKPPVSPTQTPVEVHLSNIVGSKIFEDGDRALYWTR